MQQLQLIVHLRVGTNDLPYTGIRDDSVRGTVSSSFSYGRTKSGSTGMDQMDSKPLPDLLGHGWTGMKEAYRDA